MRTWVPCGCHTILTSSSMSVWCPHCHGAGGWWKTDCKWNTISTSGTSQQEVDEQRRIVDHFNKHWGPTYG